MIEIDDLLFEIRHPDGSRWRLYGDGAAIGFPEGAKIVYQASPFIFMLYAAMKEADRRQKLSPLPSPVLSEKTSPDSAAPIATPDAPVPQIRLISPARWRWSSEAWRLFRKGFRSLRWFFADLLVDLVFLATTHAFLRSRRMVSRLQAVLSAWRVPFGKG